MAKLTIEQLKKFKESEDKVEFKKAFDLGIEEMKKRGEI